MSTASPLFSLAAPSVFCSSFGMAVQIHRQENNLPVLAVISMYSNGLFHFHLKKLTELVTDMYTICFTVNGARGPFVSQMCAFQVNSQPQEFTYLISHKAPCITMEVSVLNCQLFAVGENKNFIYFFFVLFFYLTGWLATSASFR